MRFCSNRCAAVGRHKRSPVKPIAPLDAAYLAGLIDGEGSIFIADRREGRNTWRLTVTNCDRAALEWCSKVTGVGPVSPKPRYQEHHTQGWQWQCYSWNVKAVLEQLLPHLKIKREKAQEAIAELRAIERLTS